VTSTASSASARPHRPAGDDGDDDAAHAGHGWRAWCRDHRALLSWTRVVLLFLAVAVLTHLPGFGRMFWNPDEGFLATQARIINGGGHLYLNAVDRKPPLLPYLYAGAFKVAGSNAIWLIRGLAVVAHTVTALLISVLARRRFGRFGTAAGLLYLFGSAGLAPADAQAASFEVFMLPWTVAAVLLADKARLAGSGVACAVGTLTKQTAGVTLLPVAWLAWRSRRWRGVLVVAVAFVVPVLLTALAFGWQQFFFWVFTGSGTYLSPNGAIGSILERAFGNLGIFALANCGLLVAIGWGVYKERVNKADVDLWLWLGAAGIGVVSGFHFFGHYFLQLLPPIVLLATGAMVRHGHVLRRYTLAYATLACAGFLVFAYVTPPQAQEHAFKVSLAIRQHTSFSQKILVWGMNSEIYYMADREPATRFLTAGFLTNYAGGTPSNDVGEQFAVPGAWNEFIQDFNQHPPTLIVDDSDHEPYAPRNLPVLDQILKQDYREIGSYDGDPFYLRRTVDGKPVPIDIPQLPTQ
jgi:hypothetical protein